MKKLIGIALLMAVATACSKKDKQTFCWECSVAISYDDIDGSTVTSTTRQCDLTEDQIKNVEKSGTSTTTMGSGGVNVTMHTTTTCKKVQ